MVLTRYPDGVEGKHFYQKNAPDFTPAWARHEAIDGTDYFVCNDLRTLLYVINSGAIPLHVWSARIATIDRPDWLILDLDPKEAPFAHVIELARLLHEMLERIGVPALREDLGTGRDARAGAARRAPHPRRGANASPRRSRAWWSPSVRTSPRSRGRSLRAATKVYVDFLQNGRGKLIAAPFSVRPRARAPVSMPLAWRHVTKRLDPARWNIETAKPRIEREGDPFVGVLGPGVDPDRLLAGLLERLGD